MKMKMTVAVFLLAMAWAAHAGDDVSMNLKSVENPRLRSRGVRIGDSRFVLGGSIIEGVIPRPVSANRSPVQDFLGLPVVRIIVPRRLPSPSGDKETYGKYFAWSESSSRPWSAIAADASWGDDFLSPFKGEPKGCFFSLSW
jgi:hypothetical protein